MHYFTPGKVKPRLQAVCLKSVPGVNLNCLGLCALQLLWALVVIGLVGRGVLAILDMLVVVLGHRAPLGLLGSQSCPGPFSGLTWPGGPKCTEAMCILTSEHFRAPHNPACTGPVFNPVRTPSRPGDCLALPGSTLSGDVKRQRHGAARSLATTFLLWFSAPGSPDITHTVWQPGNVCRRGQAPMARAGLQFRYPTSASASTRTPWEPNK